jgi:hypothetical protein
MWKPKRAKKPATHQMREQRACFGELAQIEGSDHDWFKGRNLKCTLLVYINDTPEQARKLSRLLAGLLCHVNNIPLNPTAQYEGQATTLERASAFQGILEDNGIRCTIRLRRGIYIQAGFG